MVAELKQKEHRVSERGMIHQAVAVTDDFFLDTNTSDGLLGRVRDGVTGLF